MRTWQTGTASALLAVAMLAPGGVAAAQETPSLSVEVARKAVLIDGGQAAALQVTTTCPAGAEVLEAFVYVNQDGNSTNFSSLNVICDGQPHTTGVTVTATDFLLHSGKASASGYLLLTSGESVSPAQSLKLK